jgi:hypothetical protein
MDASIKTVIDSLVRRLQEKERLANELRGAATELRETINILCVQAGLPPRFPDGGGAGSEPPIEHGTAAPVGQTAQINSDTFYGKKQATAVRDYLEMRRSAGTGPAKPREIYDALCQGGFQYRAKDEDTALVGLRTMLRKNTVTFHKVPGTGAYGLRSWYPNARPVKPQVSGGTEADEIDADEIDEGTTAAKPQSASAA